MAFLNRKERQIAKYNRKMKEAQNVYDGHGQCYTCRYKKTTESYFYYSYICKLNYPTPDDEEDKCEHHTYDRKSRKLMKYVDDLIKNKIIQENTND